MEYKELSKGVKIPVLGAGTWGLGKYSADYSNDEGCVKRARSNIDHVKENAGAVGWKMDATDLKRLRESFL